ncbi:MAG: FAD:protein FMN transferase [Gemmatimonadaceae bacterium]
MTGAYIHSVALMGTVVTFHVVGNESEGLDERAEAVARGVRWFEEIERSCSRFDPESEISKLSTRIGTVVEATPLVFEAVRFALAVAEETDGAFDPTVGALLEFHGFNREYKSGERVTSGLSAGDGPPPTYRDVHLDTDRNTITFTRPLLLDLGAVAKGLAVDMAVQELAPFENFAIDAGGDLYLGGTNAGGEPWTIGIRHPRDHDAFIDTLTVSNVAVCTSGDYERRNDETGAHHIMDAGAGISSTQSASVTVLASSTMVADALGTAAFVLGPVRGIELLERHGVDGFIVTPSLERFDTGGMRREYTLKLADRRAS